MDNITKRQIGQMVQQWAHFNSEVNTARKLGKAVNPQHLENMRQLEQAAQQFPENIQTQMAQHAQNLSANMEVQKTEQYNRQVGAMKKEYMDQQVRNLTKNSTDAPGGMSMEELGRINAGKDFVRPNPDKSKVDEKQFKKMYGVSFEEWKKRANEMSELRELRQRATVKGFDRDRYEKALAKSRYTDKQIASWQGEDEFRWAMTERSIEKTKDLPDTETHENSGHTQLRSDIIKSTVEHEPEQIFGREEFELDERYDVETSPVSGEPGLSVHGAVKAAMAKHGVE